jgi:GTPase SAR1 family protein
LGKTTFCKRLINNNNNYLSCVKTLGVDVSPYDYHINNRKIRLNIWDCAGDNGYKGMGSEYWIGSKGAIIFKDKSNNHLIYKNAILDRCGNIPIVYIGYDINKNINEYMVKINELINLL